MRAPSVIMFGWLRLLFPCGELSLVRGPSVDFKRAGLPMNLFFLAPYKPPRCLRLPVEFFHCCHDDSLLLFWGISFTSQKCVVPLRGDSLDLRLICLGGNQLIVVPDTTSSFSGGFSPGSVNSWFQWCPGFISWILTPIVPYINASAQFIPWASFVTLNAVAPMLFWLLSNYCWYRVSGGTKIGAPWFWVCRPPPGTALTAILQQGSTRLTVDPYLSNQAQLAGHLTFHSRPFGVFQHPSTCCTCQDVPSGFPWFPRRVPGIGNARKHPLTEPNGPGSTGPEFQKTSRPPTCQGNKPN